MPPAEPPRSSRSRKRRKPATGQRANHPDLRAPKPPSIRDIQQATARAKPLSQKPVRPQRVPSRAPGRAGAQARPLSPTPVRLDRPDRTPRSAVKARRGLAVAAYDQLSTGAKRDHVRAAEKRARQGKATEGDKAVIHAHTTRTEANRNRALRELSDVAQRGVAESLSAKPVTPREPLQLKEGFRLGETERGRTSIVDPSGRKVSEAGLVPRQSSVANLKGPYQIAALSAGGVIKGLDKAGAPKIVRNAVKDAAEIAATSPTSLTKFAVTAVTKPGKAARQLVEPYKQLAKDPEKFIKERPVSAALMIAGPARVPGRAAGAVARRTGAQTRARPAATLPSTALREERLGSRGLITRAAQSRRDKAATGPPRVTQRDVHRRVDESYAAGQKYRDLVASRVMRQQREDPAVKAMPKAQRKAHLQEYEGVAREVGKNLARRRFAKEFGATARVEHGTPGPVKTAAASPRLREAIAEGNRLTARFNEFKDLSRVPPKLWDALEANHALQRRLMGEQRRGGRPVAGHRVVEDPHAREGVLHNTRAEAEAVVEHLNAKAPTVKRGTRLYGRENVPVNFKVMPAGSKFAVVPEAAATRLHKHEVVGTSQATGAKVLRQSRGMFTRAVLPYHPTWLSGQAIEGAVRASVNQAGPVSYARAARLRRTHPEQYQQLAERATPGGLIGTAEREMTHKTLREEFPDSTIARALTALGSKPGPKQVRDLHHRVSEFVFEKVNGKGLEGVPQMAQLGRALKRHPLMEQRTLAMSKKAMDDMARGIENPETMAALARDVQNSYGKYQAFSPKMRELIQHWTPFIPWYLNTARFLTSTLPRDHPIATALLADIDTATEDWRKSVGLSFRYKDDKSKPDFMLGGYPIKGNTALGKALGLKGDKEYIVRIGHYTPFGVGANIGEGARSLPLPQFLPAFMAQWGIDWKGDQLKHPDGREYNQTEQAMYGLSELAQSMIPLAGQTAAVVGTGLEPGPTDKKEALLKQVRPVGVTEVRNLKPKRRRSQRRKAQPLPLGGGSGGGKLPI